MRHFGLAVALCITAMAVCGCLQAEPRVGVYADVDKPVVLGSPDRFGQSSRLIGQGWSAYDAWINGGMQVAETGDILTIGN